MKVFVLAVSVMLLTGLFVGWTGWYVERLCGELITLLDRLPTEMDLKEFGEIYGMFEKRWYGAVRFLKPLVGSGAVDVVEKGLLEMGIRYIGGDMVGYSMAKEQLGQQLIRMREGESVSWEAIL